MKRFSLLILLTLFFSNTSLATENSAQADSCEFISKLVQEDGAAGIDKVSDMFSWNPKIAEQAANSLAAIKNFKYDNGVAYVVADFNNIAEQHLLVIATKENGAIYFNFVFEQINGQLKLITINFNDSYKELSTASGPFPNIPGIIDC